MRLLIAGKSGKKASLSGSFYQNTPHLKTKNIFALNLEISILGFDGRYVYIKFAGLRLYLMMFLGSSHAIDIQPIQNFA